MIAIVDHVPGRVIPGKRLAQLLGRPRGRRMCGDGDVPDASSVVGQEDQDKQEATGHCRHDKEVGGDDLADMILKEGAPRL